MTYNESWNRPHQPTDAENWQESDCYWFYDSENQVGGYHRIGQYPNRGTGQVLTFAFKKGGRCFRLIKEYQHIECARTETGQTVGSSAVQSLGDGRINYSWAEPDGGASLEFHQPFYTPRNWTKEVSEHEGGSSVHDSMNADGHLEVAGRLKGRLRLGDEEYAVDALAHRDRSWGPRDYMVARQHRMVTGTLGEHLSWVAMIVQMENGFVAKVGYVARNGETTDITDLKVLTEFDWDGFTVSGLRAQLALEDGSQLELDGIAAQGFQFFTKGWAATSHHFIEVERDGTRGFTILDATNRPAKGFYVPPQNEVSLIRASDGLCDSADYSELRW
ncbi:MAG: hypothetical protein OXP09_12620 [Gammaproteobacteria bacterium]|nr:hypothetical protein [Gammaproteobacteria bacterium]MDE0366405.1 hypothetical protein [Gammaproteobacteria bacterium]